MRLLDRYLFREMLGPAVAALAAFVILVTGHVLFTVVDAIAGKGLRVESILRFAALKAPEAAILALPVATLLGCSIALNRLASDNELVPMLCGGIGALRLTRPALALGVAASLVSLGLKEVVVPRADQEAQKLYRGMLLRQKTLAFRPGEFLDTGAQWVFIAQQVDTDSDTLNRLRAFRRQPGQPPWFVTAPAATFRGHILVAPDTRCYGVTLPDALDVMHTDLTVNLAEASGHVFSGEMMQNQSIGSLLAERRERRGSAQATREYDIEIHGRLALIAACTVFSLLAAPVALKFGTGQNLAGVLATLVIAFIYYVVMLGAKLLAGNGTVPVVVAVWGQNVILAVAALWALRRL